MAPDRQKDMDVTSEARELARRVVDQVMRAGASAAEVLVREGCDFSTVVRMGALEKLVQTGSRRLGMRIFHGTRCAISSGSDFSNAALERMVRDTGDMAQAAGEDHAAGIPSPECYARAYSAMELSFPAAGTLPTDRKIALAHVCEQSSLSYDPRIRNSEGSGFADSTVSITYANSYGVCAGYRRTSCSLYACPLAESEGQKQRDFWLAAHPDLLRLQAAEEIGAEAARRALRRLGSRRVATCRVPVVFDPRTAGVLMKHLADAVSGTALVRKASFLAEKLGSRVASPLIHVSDDALLTCGLASRPFDSEGVPSQTTAVIRDGILESYLLDSYTARKLGLRTTANANRPLHGAPVAGPTNFFLHAGNATPEEIVGAVKNGLYVTELIGFGVNIVSGNFSQGAAGLWIEDGRLAFPVEEITVAGNLKDMLTSVEAVGNDLLALGEIFAPTLLVGEMAVGGS